MSGPVVIPALTLIRLPGLLSRYGHVLAPFERDLLDDLVRRFRDKGLQMTMTQSELTTFDLAVCGLDAAWRKAAKAAADAGAAALAAERGTS